MKESDLKKLKKKILAGNLAPFYPGVDADEPGFTDASNDSEECPICFLSYPALNRSKCCGKGICTECFLQLKVSKKPSQSTKRLEQTHCPFCKTEKYDVAYFGKKSWAEKSAELEEERKVEEAKQRWLEGERERDREIARKRSLEMESSSVAPSPSQSQNPQHRQEEGGEEEGGSSYSTHTYSLAEDEEAPSGSDQDAQTDQSNQSPTRSMYADYIPAQYEVLGDLPDLEELMLNQAILESLVSQNQTARDQQEGGHHHSADNGGQDAEAPTVGPTIKASAEEGEPRVPEHDAEQSESGRPSAAEAEEEAPGAEVRADQGEVEACPAEADREVICSPSSQEERQEIEEEAETPSTSSTSAEPSPFVKEAPLADEDGSQSTWAGHIDSEQAPALRVDSLSPSDLRSLPSASEEEAAAIWQQPLAPPAAPPSLGRTEDHGAGSAGTDEAPVSHADAAGGGAEEHQEASTSAGASGEGAAAGHEQDAMVMMQLLSAMELSAAPDTEKNEAQPLEDSGDQ